jgi:hypothetical protein
LLTLPQLKKTDEKIDFTQMMELPINPLTVGVLGRQSLAAEVVSYALPKPTFGCAVGRFFQTICQPKTVSTNPLLPKIILPKSAKKHIKVRKSGLQFEVQGLEFEARIFAAQRNFQMLKSKAKFSATDHRPQTSDSRLKSRSE